MSSLGIIGGGGTPYSHDELSVSKQRSSNIELYRIILIVLVIAHHYVMNSSLSSIIATHPFTARSIFFNLFGMWGKTAINGFVMISGYFMCTSHITFKKYMKLLGKVIIYGVLIGIIFALTGHYQLTIREVIRWINPFDSLSNNFVSCFLLFFLLIPFINVLIKQMSKLSHKGLIIILLFIYTFLGTIPNFEYQMNYVSWFVVIYLIGSYVRIHPCELFENKTWCVTFMLISIALAAGSVIALNWYHMRTGNQYEMFFVSDSQKPLALAVAFFSFLFFKNIKIGYSKVINTLSASTFGILLIHSNPYCRGWLWEEFIKTSNNYSYKWGILAAIIGVLGVYFSCFVIDWIQSNTVEKLWMDVVGKIKRKPKFFSIGQE